MSYKLQPSPRERERSRSGSEPSPGVSRALLASWIYGGLSLFLIQYVCNHTSPPPFPPPLPSLSAPSPWLRLPPPPPLAPSQMLMLMPMPPPPTHHVAIQVPDPDPASRTVPNYHSGNSTLARSLALQHLSYLAMRVHPAPYSPYPRHALQIFIFR